MKRNMSVHAAYAISHSGPINPFYHEKGKTSDLVTRITRDDHDEAMVCLTCTKKKCTGERGCFNARKRQLAKEARS